MRGTDWIVTFVLEWCLVFSPYMARAVSPWPGFDPRSVHLSFVVGKGARWQVSTRLFWCFPVSKFHHAPYSLTCHRRCTRVLWKILDLTMKKRIIISKLFLFFNIISHKTNTFIPAMLQRHYPVPVVVFCKMCKIPLYSCNRLLIRRKMPTSEEEYEVLGRDLSQREPNLGNNVDVPTIHCAYPLIFPLPQHFCGRVHCPDERLVFFLLQTGSFFTNLSSSLVKRLE